MPMHFTKLLGAVALLIAFATVARADFTATIHIHNNLDVALKNGTVDNKQNVSLRSNPPDSIAAGESGSFDITLPTSIENRHLNIKYDIEGSTDDVGVVYRQDASGTDRCPHDKPDDVMETVEHCGGSKSPWKYTFAPKN
jgi:hypothetical protein